MTKYDPLRRYLARQKGVSVEMTFSEIERMIGALLPKRAQLSSWWEDEATTVSQIQQSSWRAAGYRAVLVGVERVRFDRAAKLASPRSVQT